MEQETHLNNDPSKQVMRQEKLLESLQINRHRCLIM